MRPMHDWVLDSIEFDWSNARLKVHFDTYEAGVVSVAAEGVVDLHVPRKDPWGPSVHVNEVRQFRGGAKKRCRFEIEMQSGDVITITAASFIFPPEARLTSPLAETAVAGE